MIPHEDHSAFIYICMYRIVLVNVSTEGVGATKCHKDHTGPHKTLTKCLLQPNDCYNTNNCQQAWLIMKTLDVASKTCQQYVQEGSHSDAQLQSRLSASNVVQPVSLNIYQQLPTKCNVYCSTLDSACGQLHILSPVLVNRTLICTLR